MSRQTGLIYLSQIIIFSELLNHSLFAFASRFQHTFAQPGLDTNFMKTYFIKQSSSYVPTMYLAMWVNETELFYFS